MTATDPRPADDLLDRATARLDAGATCQAHGLTHCAECCFGSGFEVTTQDELDDILLVRDLAAEVRRLRAEVDRLRPVVAAAVLWADCNDLCPCIDSPQGSALLDAVDTAYRQPQETSRQ